MKKTIILPILLLATFVNPKAQVNVNLSLFDITSVKGNIMMSGGIEAETKKFQASVTIPYKDDNYDESVGTNNAGQPKKFLNVRLGTFLIRKEGDTYTHSTHGFEVTDNKPDLSGHVKGHTVSFSGDITPGFALLAGVDYYRVYAVPDDGTNLTRPDNLNVGSVFAKFYYARIGDAATVRYFLDLQYGAIINLKETENKNTNLKNFGFRLGADFYLFNVVSSKLSLGFLPGLAGKRGWATLINLGIPLSFGGK